MGDLLSKNIVQKAINLGRKSAHDFIIQNIADKDIIFQEFNKASSVAIHLLDNFDAHKFQERENNKLPISELKMMLLGAFETVTYINTLNENLNFSRNLLINHETLSDAYYIYIKYGCDINVGKRFTQSHIEDVVQPLVQNHNKLAA